MIIEPKYAEYHTAIALKDAGFNVKCESSYVETLEHTLDLGRGGDCTFPYQPPRVLKNSLFSEYEIVHCTAPEQWVVVEWFRVVHGIWVSVFNDDVNYFWMGIVLSTTKRLRDGNARAFDSPQEAYSAAFDYILNNLLKTKQPWP